MAIKVRVKGLREVEAYLEREKKKLIDGIVSSLSTIGKTIVKGIMDGSLSNWNDDSGKLRSSVGYIVLVDGKKVDEGGFSVVQDGSEGVAAGKAFAESLIPQFRKWIALIVVAGEDYASYVENIENKSVLAGGEIEARRLIDQMCAQLSKKE